MKPSKEPKQDKRGFWGSLFRARSPKTKPAKLTRPKTTDDGLVDDDAGVEAVLAAHRSSAHPPGRWRPGPTPTGPHGSVPAHGTGRPMPAPLHHYPDAAAARTPAGKAKKGPPARPEGTAGGGGGGGGSGVPAHPAAPPGPLTSWPPSTLSNETELPLGPALEHIARGAPVHSGFRREVPHAPPEQYFTLFSMSTGNRQSRSSSARPSRNSRRSRDRDRDRDRNRDRERDRDESPATDAADLHDSMTQFMTMRINPGPGAASTSSLPPLAPWDTLDQPSFAFCFGRRPGTVTLNHWAALASVRPPTIALRDSGVRPRDVDLAQICQRLRDLQAHGLDEDDPDRLYRSLYRVLLRDPDRVFSPHRTLDKQITDLILVLSRPDHWIDFTLPRNQVVTRFIFDTAHANHAQYARFFHQLLLSLELDLRIASRHHSDWAKEKLLLQLPPSLQWNLALARRWRDNVRVDAFGTAADQVRLRLKLKNRQIRMLRRFARMMKWPNYDATVAHMHQRDADDTLASISSHAMAFFSGLILPGPTFPFTIMNALIDVDPDRATDDLSLLTHLHPHCGFQYRNSYTYWTSTCIVGKVLAPTCRELAGWVGPARPTTDLGRSQIARIRTRRPRQALAAADALTMAERSDPLGPPAAVFPVQEYKLVSANTDEVVDTVRIELLTLRPAATPAPPSAGSSPTSAAGGSGTPGGTGHPEPASHGAAPGWFDASVQFAIDGISWPMRLNYNVSFVSAWPCSNKPHPLFFDYAFDVVKADEIVNVHDWATACGPPGRGGAGAGAGAGCGTHDGRTSTPTVRFGGVGVPGPRYPSVSKDGDDEKVLVVEAFGVPDNEVLARAWCAHWGLSAVVADLRETCMACAIREAYAATITVVILVDGPPTYGDE